MKKRSLRQLYTILYNHCKEKSYFFICNEMSTLRREEVITNEEYIALTLNFSLNRPTQFKHVKYFNSKVFLKRDFGWEEGAWFFSGTNGSKVRVAFIKRLINNHK